MTAQSEDSLKEYGTAVNDLINKQLALRSSLKILQSEFKELGSDATPQQIKEFTFMALMVLVRQCSLQSLLKSAIVGDFL